MDSILRCSGVVAFIHSLGVPHPNEHFISFFYVADPDGTYTPKYSTAEMAQIFKEHDYPHLAKQYHQAKQKSDNATCLNKMNQVKQTLGIPVTN